MLQAFYLLTNVNVQERVASQITEPPDHFRNAGNMVQRQPPAHRADTGQNRNSPPHFSDVSP